MVIYSDYCKMALLINEKADFMKWLEIFGTIFAAVGFGLLSTGFYGIGFFVGLASCCMLIPLFLNKNLYFLLTLQGYFAIMNVIGIGRNW